MKRIPVAAIVLACAATATVVAGVIVGNVTLDAASQPSLGPYPSQEEFETRAVDRVHRSQSMSPEGPLSALPGDRVIELAYMACESLDAGEEVHAIQLWPQTPAADEATTDISQAARQNLCREHAVPDSLTLFYGR